MRDAVEMEWEGIPSAVIVHEALAGSAAAMKTISKMPKYPALEIKFPLPPVGVWTDEEIETLCQELVPQIVHQLTHEVEGP